MRLIVFLILMLHLINDPIFAEESANDVLYFRGQEKMYRLRLSPSTTVEDIIFLVNNVIWFQVDEAVKNKCAGKDAFYFEEA